MGSEQGDNKMQEGYAITLKGLLSLEFDEKQTDKIMKVIHARLFEFGYNAIVFADCKGGEFMELEHKENI